MSVGKLIVIEGGDAAGKATQTALLRQRLEADGHQVEEMDFPRYEDNQVGKLIRECLLGHHGDFMKLDPRLTAVLYATDRRESLSQITKWIEAGKMVILDRYTSANLLHQGAKLAAGPERAATLSWIFRLEHNIMSLPHPDLLVYLQVPAALRMNLLLKQYEDRGRALDVAEADEAHQQAVDTAAADMLKLYPHHVVVECAPEGTLLSPEEIAEVVHDASRAIIEV